MAAAPSARALHAPGEAGTVLTRGDRSASLAPSAPSACGVARRAAARPAQTCVSSGQSSPGAVPLRGGSERRLRGPHERARAHLRAGLSRSGGRSRRPPCAGPGLWPWPSSGRTSCSSGASGPGGSPKGRGSRASAPSPPTPQWPTVRACLAPPRYVDGAHVGAWIHGAPSSHPVSALLDSAGTIPILVGWGFGQDPLQTGSPPHIHTPPAPPTHPSLPPRGVGGGERLRSPVTLNPLKP